MRRIGCFMPMRATAPVILLDAIMIVDGILMGWNGLERRCQRKGKLEVRVTERTSLVQVVRKGKNGRPGEKDWVGALRLSDTGGNETSRR